MYCTKTKLIICSFLVSFSDFQNSKCTDTIHMNFDIYVKRVFITNVLNQLNCFQSRQTTRGKILAEKIVNSFYVCMLQRKRKNRYAAENEYGEKWRVKYWKMLCACKSHTKFVIKIVTSKQQLSPMKRINKWTKRNNKIQAKEWTKHFETK